MSKKENLVKKIINRLKILANSDMDAAILLAKIYDKDNDIFWYNKAIDLGSLKAVELLVKKYTEDENSKIDFANAYDVMLKGIDLKIAKMTAKEKDTIVKEYLKVGELQKLLE